MKISTTSRKAIVVCSVFLFATSAVNGQCLTSTGPTNNCSYGDAIDVLTINGNTVSNAGCSGGGSGYTFFPTPVWNFMQGASYPISLNVGGAQYNQGVRIWIDFDNNGQFDATDVAYVSSAPALTHTGTLTIPPITAIGTVRMRVMCTYNTTASPTQACNSNIGTYGETEDYDVLLSPAVLPDDIEATAILTPVDMTCGNVLDTVTVRVSNVGTNPATDVPVQLDLSGLFTGTVNDTIPNIAAGSFVDVAMIVLNTQAGGTLDMTLTTNYAADGDNINDVFTTSIFLLDATDLAISGNASACAGEAVDLSVNTSGLETYSWMQDGAALGSGGTITSNPITANSQITVSSDNTCRAADTLDILLTLTPTASFSAVAAGLSVNFTGTATNNINVSWDFGDGGSSTNLTPTHTYAADGTYFVCFTAANSCDTVTVCDSVTVSTAGLIELELGEISAFPNPSSGLVTVNMTNMNGFSGDWALLDLDGRRINAGEVKVLSAKESFTISLEALAPGNYILRMEGKKGQEYTINIIRN